MKIKNICARYVAIVDYKKLRIIHMDMAPMKFAYVVDFNLDMMIFQIKNRGLTIGEKSGEKMVTHGFPKELPHHLIGIQLNKDVSILFLLEVCCKDSEQFFCGDTLRAVFVQNQADLPLRQRFHKRNGNYRAVCYGIRCQFIRVKTNAKIMLNKRKNLIRRGNLDIWLEWKIVIQKVLDIKFPGSCLICQ